MAIELESQLTCPLCDSTERHTVRRDLFDYDFGASAVHWTAQQCCECGSVYLDPRPTRQTVMHAYAGYYTHTPAVSGEPRVRGGVSKALAAVKNGILNSRFGTTLSPAIELPVLALAGSHLVRGSALRRYRSFPRLRAEASVLDVGCGSGKFLALAKRSGWKAVGLDFDRDAVDAAQGSGLDARVGDILTADLAKEQFDVITFNHSFEHLYEPRLVIRCAYGLLKPGGYLHIEMPNPGAVGRKIFGSFWRGYEVPRHIQLPSQAAMRRALLEEGFSRVDFRPCAWATNGVFNASIDNAKKQKALTVWHRFAKIAGHLSWLAPRSIHEFTSLVARK